MRNHVIFFINSTFNQKNSGIEHAQLKRAALFRKKIMRLLNLFFENGILIFIDF